MYLSPFLQRTCVRWSCLHQYPESQHILSRQEYENYCIKKSYLKPNQLSLPDYAMFPNWIKILKKSLPYMDPIPRLMNLVPSLGRPGSSVHHGYLVRSNSWPESICRLLHDHLSQRAAYKQSNKITYRIRKGSDYSPQIANFCWIPICNLK